jgi:hypothetical protein
MLLVVAASLKYCSQLFGAYWILSWALETHPDLRTDQPTVGAISKLVRNAWDSKFPESVVMWDMLNTLGIRVDVDLNSFKPYQLPFGLRSSLLMPTQVKTTDMGPETSILSFSSLPVDALMEILTQCYSESGA